MTQVITNDVSAIQPITQFGLSKFLLIDFNAGMLRRAKLGFQSSFIYK